MWPELALKSTGVCAMVGGMSSKLDMALALVDKSDAFRREKDEISAMVRMAVIEVDPDIVMVRMSSAERTHTQRLRHATGALLSILATVCYLCG